MDLLPILLPLLLRFEIREGGQTSASQGRKDRAFQVQAATDECVSEVQSQPHSRQRNVDFQTDAEPTAGHSFLDGDRAEAVWIVAFSQPCPH